MKTVLLFRKLSICFLSILLSTLAIEIFARLFPNLLPEWSRYRQWKAAITFEFWNARVFEPKLGMVLKPNMIHPMSAHPEFNFTIQTSRMGNENFGMRDFLNSTQPWAIMLGDSFIEGYGIEKENLVSELLNAKTGKKFLNLGQCGFSTNQYLAILQRASLYYRPRVILLWVFPGDFSDRFQLKSLEDLKEADLTPREFHSKARMISLWLFKNSYTYGILRAPDILLREKWKAKALEKNPPLLQTIPLNVNTKDLSLVLNVTLHREQKEVFQNHLDEDAFAQTASLVKEDLERIRREAKKIGSQLLMIYIPSKEETYVQFLKKQYKIGNAFELPRITFKTISSNLHIPFLDLTPIFRKHAEEGEQLFWRYDGHWNSLGHRLAAETIYHWMLQQKWLKN